MVFILKGESNLPNSSTTLMDCVCKFCEWEGPDSEFCIDDETCYLCSGRSKPILLDPPRQLAVKTAEQINDELDALDEKITTLRRETNEPYLPYHQTTMCIYAMHLPMKIPTQGQ